MTQKYPKLYWILCHFHGSKIFFIIKRGKFIGKINTLSQEFYFTTPEVKVTLFEKYCLSFYGSNLWDLFSKEVDKIYKSWNVSIRIAHEVPRNTHCYFIEPLSQCHHVKTLLCSRFVKFHQTLIDCSKPSVRILAQLSKNDTNTVYGSNLLNITKICDTNAKNLNSVMVKQSMNVYPCPKEEEWRIPVVLELCQVRNNYLQIDNFDNAEFEEYIEYLCTT